MKWFLRGVITLVVLILAAFAVAALLPASHVVRLEARYSASADTVWTTLTNFESWAEWNSAVERMERSEVQDDRDTWLSIGEWGEMPTVIVELRKSSRLVTEVDGGAFHGSWTYDLEPDGTGTMLTITERGQIPFPPFRLFNIGRDNTESARRFLVDLGRHFAEVTVPEVRS